MCLLFFFLPDRPTHLHEREGDGKRNILLGWPKSRENENCLHFSFVGILDLAINKDQENVDFVSLGKELIKWPKQYVSVLRLIFKCIEDDSHASHNNNATQNVTVYNKEVDIVCSH